MDAVGAAPATTSKRWLNSLTVSVAALNFIATSAAFTPATEGA